MIRLFLIEESLSRGECYQFKWWGWGVRGVTNICEDEDLYNLVVLIFYYWISLQQQSSTVLVIPGYRVCMSHWQENVCSLLQPPLVHAVVSSLFYFSILYFSSVPRGDWGRTFTTKKISIDIPQIFKHDSFTVRVWRELISDFCCAITTHDKPTSFCAIWYF